MSTVPDWQQRVIEESQQLVDRMDKLGAFTDTPMFKSLHPDEQWRMVRQLTAMAAYAQALGERINAFA